MFLFPNILTTSKGTLPFVREIQRAEQEVLSAEQFPQHIDEKHNF